MYQDANGISKSHEGWAKVAGIRAVTMRKRLRDLGWPVERAISEPVRPQVKNAAHDGAPARYSAKVRAYMNAVSTMLRMLKDKPCTDCGGCHHTDAMEFDHIPDRGAKCFDLSSASSRKLETIMAELAKCELVCANCHRERTARRRQLETLGL